MREDTASNDRRIATDAELVLRVRRGETRAFDELATRYRPALVRVARSRLGRADWAEDAVQESLLAAFKSCATYDPRYSFRTWLWTILLNQCYHHHQRRSRRQVRERTSDPTSASDLAEFGQAIHRSPLEALLAKERNEQLECLLRQLTSVQADALRLRFFAGLKFYEIAEAMECSLNTAKNRVRHGLANMAELLRAAGADQAAGHGHDWE